jgi:hypothetical protein
MAATKKIRNGVYLHIATKKYIRSRKGSIRTMWNIWNDKSAIDEFAIGFHTKSEAVEFLDSLAKKKK